MSLPTLFYAWQADLPEDTTRGFIRAAASKAVGSTAIFQEAIRLDHDSQGHAGTPPIAETVFRKIERADFFLADVSIVYKYPGKGGDRKGLPNSNVVLELGYAAAKIGWDRIILIMNEQYGNASRLPFDLRHRRFPIRFKAANATEAASKLDVIASELSNAISQCAFGNEEIDRAVRGLSSSARLLMAKHRGAVFHETNQGEETGFYGRIDHAIGQLLEKEIVVCEPLKNAGTLAYFWTHKGMRCLERLGIVAPSPAVDPQQTFDNVATNLQMYEGLIATEQREE